MRGLDWTSDRRRLKLYWFFILVVALGALAFRAPRLSLRPMHTDEAVHADNFHTLLQGGLYKYDPHEYHGPTLNFFTLIPAWLTSARSYVDLTEVTLRIVPVIFGTVLVLLTLLLVDGLGPAAVWAALFAALSPALVFYSRYYIQEMLLVCFTFGLVVCGYRYLRTRTLPWALGAGLFAGLMHATKETCIIAFGSMGLALALLILIQLGRRQSLREVTTGVKLVHVIVGLVVAMGVSALFYSSFLHYPQGVLDSYLTYANYFSRGAGANTVHVHPWYYYLQTILFARYFRGPIWTEGGLVLLALVGMATAVRRDRSGSVDAGFVRFVALYTVAQTIVYSAVPYKTPWCMLSFLHGLILLAGVGAVTLFAWTRKPVLRTAVVVVLVAITGHLAFQAYRASFVYYADSRNPYVYAHPTLEIFTIVQKVKEFVGLHGLGQPGGPPIQVAAEGNDYWPLPWYLRACQVEYRSDIPERVGPLILISSELEGALTHRIYEDTPREEQRMYLYLFNSPNYLWFRPGVKMLGFVRKAFRDDLDNREAEPVGPKEGKREQPSPTAGDAVRGQ